MAILLLGISVLDGWWTVRVAQHRLQAAGKVVGEDARIVFTVGHKGDNTQEQKHKSLDGQRSAQHTTHKAVASRKYVGIELFGAEIAI